jgi:hypothetical protein
MSLRIDPRRGLLLAAVLLGVGVATGAEAQGITNSRGLAFGELVSGATLGTAAVSPAGARTLTGGVSSGNSGGVTSASFTVTGIPLLTFSITFGGSALLTSGSHTMTVDTFASTPSGSGQIPLFGGQTLTVGGTLHVSASQSSGSYTGTFGVTVVYN